MENTETSKQSPKRKNARVRVVTALISVILVGGIVVSASLFLIAFRPDNMIARALRRALPFPVVLADGTFIAYHELDRDRESVRRFYESQSKGLSERGLRVDFETPEGKNRLLVREKDILNKLVEDALIVSLAREKGIHFSNDDVEKKFEEAIRKEGGSRKNLEERLGTLYGWNLSVFREKIIVPSLYRDALEASFVKDRDTKEAKATIEKASAALEKGVSFEKVAAEFSEGESKNAGGDLGWIDIETLVVELQEPARTQEIGVVGPIRESSLGYHILSISERKTEGKKEQVHLLQIFARKPSFPDWLAERKREKMIFILPRRYLWDQESASVLFREESLRVFEKRALERAEGDPSLIF